MLIMIFTELLMIYLKNTLYNDWLDKIKLFNGLQALFPFSLVCSLNIVYLFKYFVSPLKKKRFRTILLTPQISPKSKTFKDPEEMRISRGHSL